MENYCTTTFFFFSSLSIKSEKLKIKHRIRIDNYNGSTGVLDKNNQYNYYGVVRFEMTNSIVDGCFLFYYGGNNFL